MDWIDELFKAGCGYLGWTPDVVLNTPIAQLVLAIDGKFDFAVKTNPFGAKPKPKEADPAVISKKLAALDAIKAKAREVKEKRVRSNRETPSKD